MQKRWVAVFLCVLGILVGRAQALDLMGPPTSGLDFGKWGAGAAYFISDEEVDFEGTSLDDVETNRYYGWVGYGLSDWWEIYVRLGVMNMEIDDLGFDDNCGFLGSVGTKVTFSRGDRVDWGFMIQATWSELDDDYTFNLSEFGLGVQEFDFDLDYRELMAAVGPVIKFDGLKLYGGPFFYCLDGELDVSFASGDTTFDMEEDSRFGGYAGVIVDLGPSAAITAEGMWTGDGWGAGVNIGWEF